MEPNSTSPVFQGIKADLTSEDEKFLAGIIGSDTLASLRRDSTERGKALRDMGIGYKNSDGSDAALSSEGSVLLAISVKVMKGVAQVIQQAVDSVAISAKVVSDTEDRIQGLETEVKRLNQLLVATLEPKSPRDSKFNKVRPEDEADVNALLNKGKDEASEGEKPRKKSILEEFALMAGDDPSNYS